MTDRESPFDVKAALDESTDLITAAHADLLRTVENYRDKGPELAKTALQRLQSLNPTVSSAREAAAEGLTEELRRFGDYWAPLAGSAGLLFFALENNVTALVFEMMSLPLPTEADLEGLDPMARALAIMNAPHEAVKRNEMIMACVAVSETEVAEAVQEACRLLVARLNLLGAFILCTDPVPTAASDTPNWIKYLSERVGNEALLLGAEELVNATIGELPKHIPVVGIAFSLIAICKEVREKRETLRERRELLSEKAEAYLQPNATDDMSNQLTYLQQDDEDIKELLSLIQKLTDGLVLSPAG